MQRGAPLYCELPEILRQKTRKYATGIAHFRAFLSFYFLGVKNLGS